MFVDLLVLASEEVNSLPVLIHRSREVVMLRMLRSVPDDQQVFLPIAPTNEESVEADAATNEERSRRSSSKLVDYFCI